jgi:hypothetical protein
MMACSSMAQACAAVDDAVQLERCRLSWIFYGNMERSSLLDQELLRAIQGIIEMSDQNDMRDVSSKPCA